MDRNMEYKKYNSKWKRKAKAKADRRYNVPIEARRMSMFEDRERVSSRFISAAVTSASARVSTPGMVL